MSGGLPARQSGELGERLLKKLLGLTEPEIEIKTSCAKNYRVVIRLSQLEKNPTKTFAIVVYDRGARKLTGKTRKFERSIAQAFRRPVEIIFVNGYDLCTIISRQCLRAEFVPDRRHGTGHFAVYVPLGLLRCAEPLVWEGHTVHRGERYIKAVEDLPF